MRKIDIYKRLRDIDSELWRWVSYNNRYEFGGKISEAQWKEVLYLTASNNLICNIPLVGPYDITFSVYDDPLYPGLDPEKLISINSWHIDFMKPVEVFDMVAPLITSYKNERALDLFGLPKLPSRYDLFERKYRF